MTPKIGQMRHRLVFQKDTKLSDGEGGYTTTKSTDFTLWGFMRQLSTSELMRTGQEVGYNTYEVWVHWQSEYVPTRQHVISHNSNTYTINGVNEIEEGNRYYKLTVTRNG